MVVSVNRLRIRSILYLPGFVLHTLASRRQMLRAAGFRDGLLIADKHWAFWTITRWDSESTMRAWRGAGAHGRAMPHLKHWCDEASVARWEEPDGKAAFPSWTECNTRMQQQGRLSPVQHPSTDQSAARIPQADFTRERNALWMKQPAPL